MTEVECFGVDYERYALGKLLERFTRKYDIKNVLEIPALGAKAMPSIYSLGFGMAGCDVTLMNGDETRISEWEKLGLKNKVTFERCADVEHTELEDNSFDFVWNFAVVPTFQNPQAVITEMKRVSRKYVAVFSVNGYNVGFPVHRLVHKFTKIPWTHGDKQLNIPGRVKQLFTENGLENIEIGVVDCPPWPDSLGFRDVRLHRSNIDLNTIDWHSKLIDYIQKDQIPLWIKAVYCWERFPVPTLLKYPYSHIFYVLGEKV